jgi:hypothetical protein
MGRLSAGSRRERRHPLLRFVCACGSPSADSPRESRHPLRLACARGRLRVSAGRAPRVGRSRRNGSPLGRRASGSAPQRPGRLGWFAPIFGSTIIVVLAWAASLEQATPEIFVAASLAFALAEGIILAFVAAAWSARGLPWALGLAVVTALLATPGRWELAYLRTTQRPQLTDLGIDLAVTVAWAIFAGIAGATILRERLLTLLPNR